MLIQVRLASETAKELKEERSAGGDVAAMKNEIHKMEIRLSHLRKAQENMIRDMEFCVARRDVIMDGAMAREKRNPKGLHNQRVVFEKRMNDQKLKIKQMTKVIIYIYIYIYIYKKKKNVIKFYRSFKNGKLLLPSQKLLQ